MRLALQILLWAIGIPLQVLLIQSLVRDSYKRFPLLFAYTVAAFLTTIVEVATAKWWGSRTMARSWRFYYWADDALMQALIYAVVISLIYKAMERADARVAMRRCLIAGGFLLFVALFLLHSGPLRQVSAWMTLVSRDLSFAAVILDLLLWSKLIASKHKDHQLLLLSGGLGIQFTGSAIGQSVRELATGTLGRNAALALTGSILVAVSNLICVYIWWQTFRRPAADISHASQ